MNSINKLAPKRRSSSPSTRHSRRRRKCPGPRSSTLPRAFLLGIDLGMVIPTVSYIQLFYRHHVAVGDILIHINGHSVLDLTHMELCSMINGVSMNKSERDEIEVQRKLTKLVFLPSKYQRNLQTGDAITQAKTKQSILKQ